MKKVYKVALYLIVVAFILAIIFVILKNRAEDTLEEPVGASATFEEKANYTEVGDDEYRVRYVKSGSGEENIIFIHGLGATAYTWRHLLEPLGEYYNVYALDLIGFGLSDKPDVDLSPSYFADFIVDFMDSMGIEEAHIAGNSLGGATAAATALWHPERVNRIILIGAGGYDDLVKHRPTLVSLSAVPVLGEILILFSQVYPQGVVRSTLEESAYDEDFIDDTLVHEFSRAFVTPGYRTFLLNFTRDFEYKELEERLGQIEHRALILWGEKDEWIPLEFAYRFHEDLPNSELVIIERCGHEPQEEQPEKTAEIILDFLK